jgi:hypothetical protein
MEDDITNLSSEDLRLLFDTFSVVRSGNYAGSEVQLGFKMLFNDADKNSDGLVEKEDFFILMMGYFNSKHIKPMSHDFELYFKKIDLNGDDKISFDEYDIFVRMVYETEYLPALEKELIRRNLWIIQTNNSDHSSP